MMSKVTLPYSPAGMLKKARASAAVTGVVPSKRTAMCFDASSCARVPSSSSPSSSSDVAEISLSAVMIMALTFSVATSVVVVKRAATIEVRCCRSKTASLPSESLPASAFSAVMVGDIIMSYVLLKSLPLCVRSRPKGTAPMSSVAGYTARYVRNPTPEVISPLKRPLPASYCSTTCSSAPSSEARTDMRSSSSHLPLYIPCS